MCKRFSIMLLLVSINCSYARVNNDEVLQQPQNKIGKKKNPSLLQRLKNYKPTTEKKIFIVIPSYNNANYYKQNLDSVFMQKYSNYHVIYIDDKSPDKTGDLVEQYIKEKKQEHKVTLIKNQQNYGPMANHYTAVYMCPDDAIVVNLDGDDWLAHEDVLTLLNKVYQKFDVWLTYGQYQRYPGNEHGLCERFPKNIIKKRDFRKYRWVSSHLRSFYAWLFKCVRVQDFMVDGKFMPVCCDAAMMLTMLEMAGSRFKFIPDVLYIYNTQTPISEGKVKKALQRRVAKIVRRRKKYNVIKQIPQFSQSWKEQANLQ